VPPLRGSVLCSLQHPDYTGPCLHPDCQHPNRCKGNRVVLVDDGDGDSSDSSSDSLNSSGSIPLVKIIAPHHKVSRWWAGQAIECVLPPELAGLYYTHYQHGRELLLELGEAEQPCSFFFMQVQKGQQLKLQQASQIFASVVLPYTHTFGPQRARAIFVTSVRDKQLADVDEAAAAAVMGHSIRMWQQVYDRQRVARGAASNIAALAQWRQQVAASGSAAGAVGATGVGDLPMPTKLYVDLTNSDSETEDSETERYVTL